MGRSARASRLQGPCRWSRARSRTLRGALNLRALAFFSDGLKEASICYVSTQRGTLRQGAIRPSCRKAIPPMAVRHCSAARVRKFRIPRSVWPRLHGDGPQVVRTEARCRSHAARFPTTNETSPSEPDNKRRTGSCLVQHRSAYRSRHKLKSLSGLTPLPGVSPFDPDWGYSSPTLYRN